MRIWQKWPIWSSAGDLKLLQIGALAFLAFSPILPLAPGGLSLCPFHTLSGWPCPGCGMVRAVVALLHLDLDRALHYHPFSVLILPAVFFLAISSFSAPFLNFLAKHFRLIRNFISLSAMALLIFGVARLVVLAYPLPQFKTYFHDFSRDLTVRRIVTERLR